MIKGHYYFLIIIMLLITTIRIICKYERRHFTTTYKIADKREEL